MRAIWLFLIAVLLLAHFAASVAAQDIEITIRSPKGGSEVFAGRDIAIEVDVTKTNGTSFWKRERVSVYSNNNPCTEQLGRGFVVRSFQCAEHIPADMQDYIITITAELTNLQEIEKVFATPKTLTLKVSNRLQIELVYPNPIGPTTAADLNHVKAKLKYPETETRYELDVVSAEINGERVAFVWNGTENVFVADYDLSKFELGKPFELKIVLLGDVSGEATFNPKFEDPGSGMWIGIAFVMLSFVFAAAFLAVWKRSGKAAAQLAQLRAEMQGSAADLLREVEALESRLGAEKRPDAEGLVKRIEAIKENMKTCEVEYHTRHITQEQFMRMLAGYKRDLHLVQADLCLLKGEKGEAAKNYEKAGELEKALALFKETKDNEGIHRIQNKMLWKQTLGEKWEEKEQERLLHER